MERQRECEAREWFIKQGKDLAIVARSVQLEWLNYSTVIHTLGQRIRAEKGAKTEYVPIRRVAAERLARTDLMIIAYDAWIIGNAKSVDVRHGLIVFGEKCEVRRVKVSSLLDYVAAELSALGEVLESEEPDAVLNQHCTSCFFRDRCREKAVAFGDLSILAGMSDKERKKLRSRGLFNVTQLAYTWRLDAAQRGGTFPSGTHTLSRPLPYGKRPLM
jgi:predicted RecB family nuclease